MNRTLVLTRPGRLRARRLMLRKLAVLYAVCYAALAALAIPLLGLHGPVQLTGVVAGGIVTVGVLLARASSSPAVTFQGWGLHLDDEAIYLLADAEDSRIRRQDIRSLREARDGLLVRGGTPPHRLWVPAGVERYADVKRTLEAWLQQERQPAR